MPDLAIIGSQDVDASEWLENVEKVDLPAVTGSVPAITGKLNGYDLVILPRNSSGAPLPPHAIDYRTNIDALARTGVRRVLTTAMVGTLRLAVPIDSMLVVDQFIDFTKDRQFTFFSEERFGFADMTEPYCPSLRDDLLAAAERATIPMAPNGCYVGVAGPRFETRAEVRMFGMLGGDVIGHTGTTECVLAREAGLCYATIAGVISLGAGLSDHDMNAGLWHGSRRQHAARFRQIITEMTLSPETGDGTTGCRCAVAAPIEC